MKFLLVSLFSLLLTACQLSPQPSESDHQELKTAHTGDTENLQLNDSVTDLELVDEELDEAPAIEAVEEPFTNADYLDVWVRIEQQLTIAVPDNKDVQSQLNWYLRNPSYMQRISQRATPYMHFIVEELERRELPLELALLPIVESAFQPFAYSHGRAAGLWQIIPETGSRFGLQQNWWYDGRRDVYASTNAALDYLTYLHRYFDNDWLLAVAAYNSGEGRVRRAMQSNQKQGLGTDFWSLSLPRETRDYVPKLLALSHLLTEQEQFEYTIPEIANTPQISLVTLPGQLDLAFAAELAGIELKQLHQLNPGFNRWATAPEGPHHLLIPIDSVEQFEQKLAEVPASERVQWARYKVKSGDTISVIAQQYNTTSQQLMRLNDLSDSRIRIGQQLLVPTSRRAQTDYTLSQPQRLAQTQSQARGRTKMTYTVKSGDSFWDISRTYKVSHRDLARWNSMAPTDTLRIGQKLVIWQQSKTNQQHLQSITYRVRSGDSLSTIASRYSVRVSDLLKWNNLGKKEYLQPGQRLRLYIDVTEVNS